MFSHLHTHSSFSLLDSICQIEPLVAATRALGQSSLALTDHGNMHGAIEFYQACRKASIKPIIGSEFYVSPFERTRKEPIPDYPNYYHLILLAKNYQGYANLLELSSLSFLEGYYYQPRIDRELIEKYSKGLICLSACMKGPISYWCLQDKDILANQEIDFYHKIFGDDFYLELQHHKMSTDDKLVSFLRKAAQDRGIKCIATNDVHYIEASHHEAHDVLLCIKTRKKINAPDRMRYDAKDLYLKSEADMLKDFSPDEVDTDQIVNKCELEIPLGQNLLPTFGEANQEEQLRALTKNSPKWKNISNKSDAIKRAKFELDVIGKMGMSGYFLIVSDLVNWAKRNDIAVGCGRGSAAGSLVTYLLDITDVNPLTYGLLFERFLNPDRIAMADIDIDFADNARSKVIDYVRSKYGNVTQITTFGRMKAKMVIKDVGRALSIPYEITDLISKALDGTLSNAMLDAPISGYAFDYPKLFQIAEVLEGCHRHRSIHAAGVVIAPGALTKYLPLCSDKGTIASQFDMYSVDALGLLKIDFLGLRTLSVLHDIEKVTKVKVGDIPLDDHETYENFGSGQTTGIFQFESSGMKGYLQQLKPKNIEDLAIMNALYRPGPIEGGVVDEYLARRNGAPVTYLHEKLRNALEPTLGEAIYQESVMQITRDIAGFTLGQADTMRKAIGKKDKKLMEEQKELFIKGSLSNQIAEPIARKIFDLIEKFAGYGFNKCLTGDTQVRRLNNRELGKLTISLNQLYDEYHADGNLGRKRRVKGLKVVGGDSETTMPVHIIDIQKNGVQDVWELITTDGMSCKATQDHRFLANGLWTPLSEITVGDYIRVSNYADPTNVKRIRVGHKMPRPLWGRYRAYDDTVSCIRYIGKEETYDVEIAERSHCFYANGILSHNSHAVGYAILGYQAEYYKTHYPLAFMWASLVSEIGDKDRINILLNECKQKKIKILPPDINESKQTFALIDTYIRFGFNALASVSDKMGEEIVANAPYDSFYDFIGKVKCNINVANALIYAGCFDHFGTRKGHIEIAARELTASRKIKKSTMYHWLITPKAYHVSKEEFDKETLLIKEYEVLSFYITSHPITLFKKQIIESKMKRLNKKQEGQYLTCGLISSIKLHIDKKKNQMAFVTLEDIDGSSHEMVCFSSTYSLYKGLLSVGKVIGISCNVEKGKLIANWIGPMKF